MSPHSLPSVLDLSFTTIHDTGLFQHSNQTTQTTYHKYPWLHCQRMGPSHNNNRGAPNVHEMVHRVGKCTRTNPNQNPHTQNYATVVLVSGTRTQFTTCNMHKKCPMFKCLDNLTVVLCRRNCRHCKIPCTKRCWLGLNNRIHCREM